MPFTNFKWIPGFEGIYAISEQGEITNHKKIMKTYTQNSGYQSIKFTVNNIRTSHLVHRLVALTWVANPYNKPCINHIDGNKQHNYSSNLEWVTASENLLHSYKNGLSVISLSHLGKKHKRNPSSQYHNVSFDKNRDKWIGCVRENNKTIAQKRFNTEIEAAQYVNFLIDKFNLIGRTKNKV